MLLIVCIQYDQFPPRKFQLNLLPSVSKRKILIYFFLQGERLQPAQSTNRSKSSRRFNIDAGETTLPNVPNKEENNLDEISNVDFNSTDHSFIKFQSFPTSRSSRTPFSTLTDKDDVTSPILSKTPKSVPAILIPNFKKIIQKRDPITEI